MGMDGCDCDCDGDDVAAEVCCIAVVVCVGTK